ncbi:MAG TPA: hypothetical protein VFK90_08520 [Anaeromyxobacter sp.]|nr:hypothetical protein [Anaeromyxobacter sp.]
MRLGRLATSLAAALTLGAAAIARAEPLDVSLLKLGPPDPAVWVALGADPAQAGTLSADAKRRFAILSNDVALAMSSALLQPGSTTGHSGWDVALEGTYSSVHDAAIGTAQLGFGDRPWATTSVTPSALVGSGIHVRKALPFSFEMGGRLTYLAMTSYVAAQGEAKWALNEGFDYFPDVAVRAAYTRLFGQTEWNLDTTDLDVLVSKRWGVSAVTSFTPYVAARFTFVNASSERMDFANAPSLNAPPGTTTFAGFPNLRTNLYRTTLGVRMTANAVSLAVEGTYFAGTKHSGDASPAAGDYPDFRLASSWSAAFRLGWEF